MESLKASEVSLYAAGVPVTDELLVSEFENTDIELTVGLLGGKVHGSLARAGNIDNCISVRIFHCDLREKFHI